MSFGPREYLQHVLLECEYLERSSGGLDFEAYRSNETLQRAFVRSLEVIGEASKHLSREFRGEHADIDWRAIVGMRDRLIHGYFGVDHELVWDTVVRKIPDLRARVAWILHQL